MKFHEYKVIYCYCHIKSVANYAISIIFYSIKRLYFQVVGAEDKDRRIAQDALDAAENVQKKYAEYQKFHAKEVGRLKNRIKELSGNLQIKEDEFNLRAKEVIYSNKSHLLTN